MRKYLLLLPLLFVAALPKAQPVKTVKASTAAPGISRSTVIAGDPTRGRVLAWDRQGRLPADGSGWSLVNAAGKVTPLVRMEPGRESAYYDPSYHGEVAIPLIPPGLYTLKAGPVSWPLTVAAKIPRGQRATLGPGTTAPVLAAKLVTNDVLLQPGLYELTQTVPMPPGSTLTGPGAIIRYTGPTPSTGNEWQASLFAPGAWSAFDGLTFDLNGYRPFTAAVGSFVSLNRCTFINSDVNQIGAGLYAESCTFDGSSIFQSPGLMRRCRFAGNAATPYTIWAADHNTALVDCTFDGCGRGPVFGAVWGDIRGNLFLGTTVRNVDWSNNGCESFLCEPGVAATAFGFHDNLTLHTRLSCSSGGGPAVQWDGHASGNLNRDSKISGGQGFTLWGDDVHDNEFAEFELFNGASIRLRTGATNNSFHDAGIVWRPGNVGSNEQWIDASWYTQANPIWVEGTPGAGNTMARVFFLLPAGVQPPNAAFAWTGCQVNGVNWP